MKLETEWDFCLFKAETEDDRSLLRRLFDGINLTDRVQCDLIKNDEGKIIELCITTYY